MARRYARDRKGRFASTGASRSNPRKRVRVKNGTRRRRARGTQAVPNRGGLQFDFATGGITLQVGKGDIGALVGRAIVGIIGSGSKVNTK